LPIHYLFAAKRCPEYWRRYRRQSIGAAIAVDPTSTRDLRGCWNILVKAIQGWTADSHLMWRPTRIARRLTVVCNEFHTATTPLLNCGTAGLSRSSKGRLAVHHGQAQDKREGSITKTQERT
jgi:hypothetical protein